MNKILQISPIIDYLSLTPVVDKALEDLEKNGDIKITTERGRVVDYIINCIVKDKWKKNIEEFIKKNEE